MPVESHATSLTAVVMTRNEAHQIAACVGALRFAAQVLVVDSDSTDGTREVAAAAGATVVVHPFTDYASQRNFGLERVATAWALMVDADERVTPELAGSIARSLAEAGDRPEVAGFSVLRRNHFMGRPLRRAISGRERLVRLLRVGRARYVNAVHETPIVEGEVRHLDGAMDHLTNTSLRDAFGKIVSYAVLWARDMDERGRTTTAWGIAGHTLHRWVKVYVFRGGFLEGARGFLLAGFESVSVFFKYAMLWERGRRDR